MTSHEAIAKCKRRYKDGDIVQCVYQGIPGKEYTIDLTHLRYIGNCIVCDDVHTTTPFVVLYRLDIDLFAPIFMVSTDSRVTDVYIPKKQPHKKELISHVISIARELDKYDKIGSILGSIQKYQKEETLLDQQLRNFKNR